MTDKPKPDLRKQAKIEFIGAGIGLVVFLLVLVFYRSTLEGWQQAILCVFGCFGLALLIVGLPLGIAHSVKSYKEQ